MRGYRILTDSKNNCSFFGKLRVSLRKPTCLFRTSRCIILGIEKKNYGKVSMGVVRTTYLIDEQGVIIKANDKVKAADDPENMLKELD